MENKLVWVVGLDYRETDEFLQGVCNYFRNKRIPYRTKFFTSSNHIDKVVKEDKVVYQALPVTKEVQSLEGMRPDRVAIVGHLGNVFHLLSHKMRAYNAELWYPNDPQDLVKGNIEDDCKHIDTDSSDNNLLTASEDH